MELFVGKILTYTVKDAAVFLMIAVIIANLDIPMTVVHAEKM